MNNRSEGARAVSVAEAGKILGVHPITVVRAIDRGEIKAVRLGRRILVPTSAVEALLAGRKGRRR